MPNLVGRAKGLSQVPEEDLLKTFGGRPEAALGAVFVLGFGKFLGGKVEGFVPRGRPPVALSPFTGANQRTLQARRVIYLKQSGVPACAEHAPALWAFGIGIQLMDDAVFHHRNQRALVHAHLARGGYLDTLRFLFRRVVERLHISQRGSNGCPRSATCRELEKSPPIHK